MIKGKRDFEVRENFFNQRSGSETVSPVDVFGRDAVARDREESKFKLGFKTVVNYDNSRQKLSRIRGSQPDSPSFSGATSPELYLLIRPTRPSSPAPFRLPSVSNPLFSGRSSHSPGTTPSFTPSLPN